jgi:hypothetical protein
MLSTRKICSDNRVPGGVPVFEIREVASFGQIGLAALQFGGLFHHLRFKFVARFAKLPFALAQRCLGAAVIVDEACHPK